MNEIIDVRSVDVSGQSRPDPRVARSDFAESLAQDRYARRLDAQEARIRRKLATLRELMEGRP